MSLPAPFLLITKRLERWLKVDLRYVFTGGSFLTLTQATSAVSSLIVTVAFANLIPMETYGTYRYVLALYSLFAIAALPGIDTAVLQSVSRGYDRSYLSGVTQKFRWGLLGSLAAFGYAIYQHIWGDPSLALAFAVLGAALPCMESLSLSASFLNAKRKFGTWAALDVLTQAVSLLSLIGTMFLTDELPFILLAYFLPYIFMRLAAVGYTLRFLKQGGENDPGFTRYGKSMSLFQVVAQVVASLDQIVLFQLLGPSQLAIYSLATAVPNRLQSVFRISGTLASPKFASRTPAEIAESLPRKMLLFGLGITAVCVAYVLAAPLLFTYIFPNYLPSIAFSQVAVFFTLSAVTYPFGSYLFAHKKIRENYILAIAGFVVKAGCLVTLVPLFGLWGAVIGLLATSLTTISLSLYLLYRDRRITNIDT